jgi:hypothetical protein
MRRKRPRQQPLIVSLFHSERSSAILPFWGRHPQILDRHVSYRFITGKRRKNKFVEGEQNFPL